MHHSVDFDRRLELRDGELGVSVLTLFVVLRLLNGLLYQDYSDVLGDFLTVCCWPGHFCIANSDFNWKPISAKPVCRLGAR